MPNEKKKPSKETLKILMLYDKGLEAKEIAKRLSLSVPSVAAREAHRTRDTYGLEATRPKVDSPRLALSRKQSLAVKKDLKNRSSNTYFLLIFQRKKQKRKKK